MKGLGNITWQELRRLWALRSAHRRQHETDSAIAGVLNGPFIRQLRHEPWFAAATAGCLTVLLVTAASLPRIWRTTPAGFSPEIRISGFDRLEARLEASRALSCDRRGDLRGALLHRRAAVVANPANLESLRALLATEARFPTRDPRLADRLSGEIRWLLALGGTNRADLERAIGAAVHLRAEALLGTLVASVREDAPTPLRMERAKWLLRSGDFDGFAQVARQVHPSEGLHDAEWHLYWLAWIAGRDSPAPAKTAQEELETRSHQLAMTAQERQTALRLLFLVAVGRNDPAGAGSALSSLRDAVADEPEDHARFWELLARLGRADEARRLASTYSDPPAGAAEQERIGSSLTQLGLWDEAIEFYSRCSERRGRVWVAHGSALVRRQRWREVRELATRMRARTDNDALWLGYSRYLDGVAFLGFGQTNEAIGEFRRLLETSHCDPRAALAVGADLVQRRFPEVALGLLHRREKDFAEFPEFWRILVRAAVQQGDAELMLTAARHEWALDPTNLESANDLSVALLVNETEPELTRQLTRRLLDADPESVPAMIHHSLALLGDGLPRAARPLLESLDSSTLPAAQRNSLAYARALLAADDQRPADVIARLRELHPAFLFPGQQAHAEALWQRIASAQPARRP